MRLFAQVLLGALCGALFVGLAVDAIKGDGDTVRGVAIILSAFVAAIAFAALFECALGHICE